MLSALTLLSVLVAQCPAELFRVERNKNANVVLYEAKAGPDGALDPREPIVASWLLLARGGGREGLNFVERFAYGFEVRPATPGYAVELKALKGRNVKVQPRGACHVALATIGGKEAVLQRVYVTADEQRVVPAVQSVELFGIDPVTGEAVREKIDAKHP